jgi:hypothetical protein
MKACLGRKKGCYNANVINGFADQLSETHRYKGQVTANYLWRGSHIAFEFRPASSKGFESGDEMAMISWRRLACLSLLLLGLSSLVTATQAATYYVSPTGSNSNPGTISAPFATLQKAHDIANPGDTIYMRGGTYMLNNSAVQISRSGSSGNPITVINYPGETPVLDGINITTSYRSAIQLTGASWWHFQGLEIKNAAAMGIYLTGASNNNIIEQCVTHHNVRIQLSGAGIQIDSGGASNDLILNNDSHHNGIYGTNGGDGIANSSVGTGNVIHGNRVWRNNDDGIDLWGSQHALVENNWSWENGKKDDLTPSGGNGTGFKLGGGSTPDGLHTIQNNLAWRNRASGFDDNSANLTMNLFNNTSWDNGNRNFSFYTHVAFVLKNNLSFPNSLIFISASEVVQQNNSWNLAVTVDSLDFVSLDYSGATGPRDIDGSLPVINFLKLSAGSDLIGKGVNVGLPYNGSAPDLGAYEYGGSLPPPTDLRIVSNLP